MQLRAVRKGIGTSPRRDSALECGSPLPLLNSAPGRIGSESARGLAQSKT
jgi:hypothetical protein